MFNKNKNGPKKSRLMGEDFDIFPDLGDSPKPDAAQNNPPPEEEEEDPGPTDFQLKIAKISETNWRKFQIAAGSFLGLLCGACITIGGKLIEGSTSTIIAFGVALIIPGIIEKQSARKTPRLRIAMCITLFIWLAGYMAYGYFTDPSFFKAV